MNGELPEGWVWTSLEMIVSSISNGITEKQNKERLGIPVTRIETISNGTINMDRVGYLQNLDNILVEKYKLSIGDILFSNINSDFHLGKTAIFEIHNEVVLHGMNLLRIKPIMDYVSSQFLNYLFNYYRYSGVFISIAQHAVNQSSINQTKLKNLEVPLPPLAEQQRIVNKIEELFTNLDKGVESLNEVKSKLKTYRQAILKYAIEGKLTEKWREKNKNRVESEILQLVKSLEEKQKILTDGNSNDLEDTCSPTSWVRLRLTELTKTINPGFPCGRHNNEGRGVLHVRPMNIDREGRINLVNTKYVETNIYDSLSKGDILFNNTNSSELVGKTTYIESDTNWAYSNHMTRIRINNPLINNKWISTYLHFLFLSGYFGGICIHHVNQSSVSSRVLSEKIPIPIPSISEQNFILQNIDQYFSIVNKEFETINCLLEQSKTLRQSILKKAFEGKLVPQYPNEESTEILIEKIKKQKSNKEKLIQEKMI